MFNRKRMYILLISLFAVAVAFILARTFIFDGSLGTEVAGSLKDDGEAAKVIAVPKIVPVDKLSGNEGRSEGQENYPLVMRLLKSSQKKQVFGSFRLISIIEHDTDPESSRATIEDMNTGSSRTYLIQDTLPDDSKLVGIKQDHVVLQKSGVRKRIYFHFQSENPLAKSRSGFREINDGEFDLNPYRAFRGDASSVLDFSMKAHSRNGEMDGIQVTDIEHNPLFQALGLKEGDVLVEVNGKPVDSLLNGVRSGIDAYFSDDLQLKIRRGNQDIILTYHLFWEGQGSWTPMDVLNSKAVSSLFDGEFASHLF